MADRTVRIVLGMNVSGVVSGFRTASTAAQDFSTRTADYVQRNQQSIGHLSNTIGGIGLGLTGLATVAVKKFADFDEAMSAVAATGDDARGSIDALREAALDAGATTVFSATEAAAAVEELAKAGVSAADILGGGLDGALVLAAAGGLDVAQAAEIASVALNQFSLGGEDVTHVADLLAAGAGKAMGTVEDLGAALEQGGLVAAQTGLTIEETTGALAAFASAGLLGSDAGTSLKTMLQRLTPQSKEAQEQFDALGLSAYDANGNFVGLEVFAGRLQTAMKDMTPEARNAAMAVMFGSDAVRAASVLYNEGSAGIGEWTDAVDDQGYAAETAATKLDNLKGDVEAFTGALETALIGTGSVAAGPLRDVVQGATAAVSAFSEAPDAVQSMSMAIVGGGGLVALGVAGLGRLVTGVGNVRESLQQMRVTGQMAGAALGVIGVAVTIGAIAFSKWASNVAKAKALTEEYAQTLDELGNTTDDTVSNINAKLSSLKFGRGLSDWIMGEDSTAVVDWANEIGIATEDLVGYILGQEDAITSVTGALEDYDNAWDLGPKDEDKMDALTDILNEQAAGLSEAEKQAGRKAQADAELGIAESELVDEIDPVTAAVEEQTTAVEELWDAHMTLAGNTLSVRDAQRELEASFTGVNESIEAQVADLATHYESQGLSVEAARARAEAEVAVANKLDITTAAGRANQAALDAIATSGLGLVDSMRAAGASEAEIAAAADNARAKFVQQAEALGMSSAEANALADEVGLATDAINAIPTTNTVAITVTTSGYDQLMAIQTQLRAITGNHSVHVATGAGGQGGLTFADGGFYKSFADGGVESHAAQIAPAGAYRVWAEPETGGEAYIPLALSKRAASLDIWAQTGKYLGVTGYADGGVAYRYPSSSSATSVVPPAAAPSGDIYVQNPFTGEYLLAQVAGVASGVVTHASQARSAGVRGGRR